MKPRSAKNKGKKHQNLIAQLVRNTFGLSENDVKSTTMGESGLDIQLSDNARKFFPYAVEAKSYARIAIYRWWEQCKKNAESEELSPLLVVKENRGEELAILRLKDFIGLLKK